MSPVLEPSVLAIALAVTASALAVHSELRTGEIPNWITLGGLGLALALALLRARFALHATGFALAALPGLVVYRHGAIGGGAYKLMVAVAALAGPTFALAVWLAVGFVFLKARLGAKEAVEVPSSPWVCVGVGLAAVVSVALDGIGPWL